MKKHVVSLTRLMVLLAAVLMIVFNTTAVKADEIGQEAQETVVAGGEKDQTES